VAAPIVPFWYGSTIVGAWLGKGIPDSLALDFAIPITFLAIITPMLRTPAHIAAAVVAVAASLMLTWLPYSMGVLLAGFAGMITGAYVELRLERAKP